MNIPQLPDVRVAYEMYLTKTGLTRKDIEVLFGVGKTYAGRLKALAKEYEKSKGLKEYSVTTVRTEEAFKAWGLDIRRITRRATALRKEEKE